MHKIFYGFLILIILPVSATQAQDSASFNPKNADYFWPTNASHALSATFAETRSRHFHAALDIKTWGQRGYPVYATRSGTLHRMAIGPTGYGKVLYLKHDDGSYSVYAHLLRFNDSLQQMADSIRFRDYSSSLDIITDSLNIRIEQGDEIALSGASGIGPPHLHFELRTPQEEPFNPLLTNLKVRDTIAPSFSGLAVEPLSIQTKIEGRNRIYTKRVSRGTEYAHFGTINVSGPVGLAVDVFDQANGVNNVYAVYSLKMRVDGQTVFESKVDQFSYDETDQIHIDRIYPLLETTGKAYQRMYVADGNTLRFYKSYGNKGRLNLSPGRHKVVIEAIDYYGNSRKARATLNVKNRRAEPALLETKLAKNISTSIDPNNWQWFNDWVNIPLSAFQQLTLAPLISSPTRPVYHQNDESVSVDLSVGPQFYFRTSSNKYFISRRVQPDSRAYIAASEGKAYASFPAGSFYDATSLAITLKRFAPDSVRINLFPYNIPIRKSFTISVQMDAAQLADSTLSYYKISPDNQDLQKLSTTKKGAYLTATPSSLGSYIILPDRTPPKLESPRIVKSSDDKWLIYISVKDDRSGIDYKKTKLYVNGVRGIVEYEPESSRLVYYHPAFTPKSLNTVKIIAFDKIGNRVIKEATLSF